MTKMAVKTGDVSVSSAKGPRCPRHDEPMKFSAIYNHFECTVQGCSLIAHPKKDYDSYSQPTILESNDNEIVVRTPDSDSPRQRFYVRHNPTNTMIEITNLITGGAMDSNKFVSTPVLRLEIETQQWVRL